MITEDYVSFEIAKLLKEKGFDEGCSFIVNTISKGVMPVSWPTTNSDIEDAKACLIALPTLQMVMKWLREEHRIFLNVSYIPEHCAFTYRVISPSGETKFVTYVDTYEQACEAAIKYCLENLI